MLFVIGSAIVRDLNVLLLLTGIMVGAFLFHWRLVRTAVSELEVKRELPPHAFAGDEIPISILVENQKLKSPSWTLVVEDSWKRVTGVATESTSHWLVLEEIKRHILNFLVFWRYEKRKSPPVISFPLVRGGERCCLTYHREVLLRGEYKASDLRIWSRFPIGLLKASRSMSGEQSIVVYPQLGKLTMRWKNAIESPQFGTRSQQQRRGFNEGDYYGLREWRSGDSKRWIHWRSSAKLGELTVKQFEQQTDTSLALMLDLHLPENPSDEDRNQVENAIRFAASAIVELSERLGNSRLSVTVIGQDYRHWFGPTSHRLTHSVLRHLATVEAHSVHDELPHDWEGQLMKPHDALVVISTRNNPQTAALSPLANPLWLNTRSELAMLYFDPDA